MSTTLDGQLLFDEGQSDIELGSLARDCIERTIPGLDGILSIDLGGRGRIIKQRGVLHTRSRSGMADRLRAISSFMDGDIHHLVTSDNTEYENLRMDSFRVDNERMSGNGVLCDYEVIYKQLGSRK